MGKELKSISNDLKTDESLCRAQVCCYIRTYEHDKKKRPMKKTSNYLYICADGNSDNFGLKISTVFALRATIPFHKVPDV